jgi:hypothetical protein
VNFNKKTQQKRAFELEKWWGRLLFVSGLQKTSRMFQVKFSSQINNLDLWRWQNCILPMAYAAQIVRNRILGMPHLQSIHGRTAYLAWPDIIDGSGWFQTAID